jgi:hypothetical protein
MQHADFLQTLSQISVMFVGFAGVVSALSPAVHPKTRSFRVRSLIGWSLFALFFSILPLLLGQFGIAEYHMWRLCSGILAVGHTVATIIVWHSLIPLYRDNLVDAKPIAILITLLTVLVVIMLFANALGIFPAVESGIYFGGVLFALAVASYLFVKLVILVQHDNEDR